MKFYFAHSHKDHDFVSNVADDVGRPLVIFDEYSFDKGKTFRRLMRENLERSEVFVLFATREALRRSAVEFEIAEAEDLALAGRFNRILVFMMDDDLPFSELPKWLSAFNAMRAKSARQCAREILLHYRQLTQTNLIYGREKEAEDLVTALIPMDVRMRPHAFVVFGFPGTGRRTLVTKVATEALDYPKTAVLRVGVGDGLLELRALLADELGIVHTDADIDDLLKGDPTASAQLAAECARHIAAVCKHRTLPIIIDDGGLADNDGFPNRWFRALLTQLGPHNESYLGVVSRRRFVEPRDQNVEIPQQPVAGLPRPAALTAPE